MDETILYIYGLKLDSDFSIVLTHCGLATPYGVIDLGQHWLR